MTAVVRAHGTGPAAQLPRRPQTAAPTGDFLAAVAGILKDDANTAAPDARKVAAPDDGATLPAPTDGGDGGAGGGSGGGNGDPAAAAAAQPLPPLLLIRTEGVAAADPAEAAPRALPLASGLPAVPVRVTSPERPESLPQVERHATASPADAGTEAIIPVSPADAIDAAMATDAVGAAVAVNALMASPVATDLLPRPPQDAEPKPLLPQVPDLPRLRATVTSVATHFAPDALPRLTPRPLEAGAAPGPAADALPAAPAAVGQLPAAPAAVPAARAPAQDSATAEFTPLPARQTPAGESPLPTDQPDTGAAPARDSAAAEFTPLPARQTTAAESPPPADQLYRRAAFVGDEARPAMRIAPAVKADELPVRTPARLPSGSREPAKAPATVERAPDADASPAAPAAAVPIGLGATEIRRLAETISDTAKTLAAPDRATPAAPSGVPVRVVTLTLNPEHLGRVALTIRLAGDRLSVRMDAEKEETARMIESDGEALVHLLGADGYGVEALTVAASGDLMQAAQNASPTSYGAAIAMDPGAGSQRQSGRDTPGDGRGPFRSFPSQDSEASSHEEVAAPPPGVGRIYV